MLVRGQALTHRRNRKDRGNITVKVVELNNHLQSLRHITTAELGSVGLESRRLNALGLLSSRDRHDPAATLSDATADTFSFDTRVSSVREEGADVVVVAFPPHGNKCSIWERVALNIAAASELPRGLLRPAVRRHVVLARRTVEDATVTPQHVSAVYLVDGCHLASPLRVEEHNPAVVVRFIITRRRPAAPEPQRDHRIVRREETDRLSG